MSALQELLKGLKAALTNEEVLALAVLDDSSVKDKSLVLNLNKFDALTCLFYFYGEFQGVMGLEFAAKMCFERNDGYIKYMLRNSSLDIFLKKKGIKLEFSDDEIINTFIADEFNYDFRNMFQDKHCSYYFTSVRVDVGEFVFPKNDVLKTISDRNIILYNSIVSYYGLNPSTFNLKTCLQYLATGKTEEVPKELFISTIKDGKICCKCCWDHTDRSRK